MIPFILNLPYTLFGILVALALVPREMKWNKKPMAIVFRVRYAWPLDVRRKGWRGATVGQTVILNPREEPNDLAHELVHVEQLTRVPLIGSVLYVIELWRHGYRNNKYEIEAYDRSGSVYRGKEKILP